MKYKILGHRGYKALYPENTILAFNNAFSLSDGVEFDIQKTKDNHFVVIHDSSIDRTSNGSGELRNCNYADIKDYDYGRGEKLSELCDVLKISGDKYVNVELKLETIRREDAGDIIKILNEHDCREKIIISSFEHSLLHDYKRAGFKIGYLIGDDKVDYRISTILKVFFKLRPDYMNLPVSMFEKKNFLFCMFFIYFFKLSGSQLIFWTVNTEREFNFIHKHASFIITNEIEKIKLFSE